MTDANRHTAGFRRRTRLRDARDRLRATTEPVDRRMTVDIEAADGRFLAEPLAAIRDVPHYARAAMDGYAVRASDTFGASDRAPSILRLGDEPGPQVAVRVHTGSALPDGADAVVMLEHADQVDDELQVLDGVAEGENVGDVGEDVQAGQRLFETGHRLRPSDLGLLKAVGYHEIPVVDRPTVAVIPTGEELVQTDPSPGEIVETNGLTVSRSVERWGGTPRYRPVVTDDVDALRVAIERDLTADLVVTTGGSSVGERDLLPEVVDDLGEVLVHGVALKPGHPVAIGQIAETPVVMLPGYPVACIVNAVQFVRPAIQWLAGAEPAPHPTVSARLTRKITSEPGTRTFARVKLGDTESGTTATPTRASGAGVLSSVALADGWVVVPEDREGIPAGETVAVERWEWLP